MERSVTIRTSTILKVLAILVGAGLVWMLRDVFALLLVALFLAGLMHPAARWAAKHRIPKALMVLGIYMVAFSGFALALTLIVPTLVREAAIIVPTLVRHAANLSKSIGTSLEALTIFGQTVGEFTDVSGLSGDLSTNLTAIADQFGNAANGLLSILTGVFGGIAGLIVVLVMAFYMVVEDKEAVRVFRNFVPEKHQAFIAELLTQVETKIGGWLRGQLLLSFIVAVLYYVGLLVIGVPGPLPLALFAGFAEFIPYLGPILGGIPIVIVAFNDSPVKALLAGALLIVIQQVENHILVPKVMQRTVGLNPLVSIIAVLIGVKLFGFMGVLLAIPFATALSVLLTELYRYRKA